MDLGEILGAVITIALSAVGGIVWLVRLEGRINTETSLRESQLKGLLDRQNGFEERIYSILERIESKLDGKVDK